MLRVLVDGRAGIQTQACVPVQSVLSPFGLHIDINSTVAAALLVGDVSFLKIGRNTSILFPLNV